MSTTNQIPPATLDIADSIDVLFRSDYLQTETNIQLRHEIPTGITVTPGYLKQIESAWDQLHAAAEAFRLQPLSIEIEETFRRAVQEFNEVMSGK